MTTDGPLDPFLDDGAEQGPPDWDAIIYESFNPDRSVGVACNRNGQIVGLYLDDDARDNGDTWLATEIVRVAALAYQKSRVGLRAEMAFNGTPTYTLDSFGLPTETEYNAMEEAEFGHRRG